MRKSTKVYRTKKRTSSKAKFRMVEPEQPSRKSVSAMLTRLHTQAVTSMMENPLITSLMTTTLGPVAGKITLDFQRQDMIRHFNPNSITEEQAQTIIEEAQQEGIDTRRELLPLLAPRVVPNPVSSEEPKRGSRKEIPSTYTGGVSTDIIAPSPAGIQVFANIRPSIRGAIPQQYSGGPSKRPAKRR